MKQIKHYFAAVLFFIGWILTGLFLACDLEGPIGPEGLQGPPGTPGASDTLYIYVYESDTVYVESEDGRAIVWLTEADLIGSDGMNRYFDINYTNFKQRRASPLWVQPRWAFERWEWVTWRAVTCEDLESPYYNKLGIAETTAFLLMFFYWDVLE